MRRDDDVLELEQRARIRLGRIDVERCRGDLAALQSDEQRVLVHELAACRVDDAHAVAHLRDRRRVDRAARLVRQRQVQREEVRTREHLVERRALDAELAKPFGGHERVVGEDAQLEAERAARDLLADAAEAEHAQRLARELDAPEARALPAAVLERRVRLRDVAGQREQQPDRVLGRRDDGRLRRVRHDDAAARRRLDVDVVHADARAADHLQIVRARDQVGTELGRRADDDPVVAPDRLREVRLGVDVDVEAVAQQLDAGGRNLLPDEDLEFVALSH